ncbi:MAG: DUF4276 family protein [Alphaproteobacteria bacterium]|nr:DUF4276 family protein [Alphaproteobacteria bacterium]
MKRLVIIVEGFTEQDFVEKILKNNLVNLSIDYINLRGGRISIDSIIKNVQRLIHNYDYVTTLVDYYGFKNSQQMSVEEIERELQKRIANDKFIPYLQKYEFEALLFSDKEKIEISLGKHEELTKNKNRPEEINHGNPPSKLLSSFFSKYIKRVHGINILKTIGFQKIRQECPRFNEWITKLETLG